MIICVISEFLSWGERQLLFQFKIEMVKTKRWKLFTFYGVYSMDFEKRQLRKNPRFLKVLLLEQNKSTLEAGCFNRGQNTFLDVDRRNVALNSNTFGDCVGPEQVRFSEFRIPSKDWTHQPPAALLILTDLPHCLIRSDSL